jgi:integrase
MCGESDHRSLWSTGVHEAGHALVALVEGVDFVSVDVARTGNRLGYLSFDGLTRRMPWAGFTARVASDLGGAVAEEIVFGEIDDPRAPTYGPELVTALRIWKKRYRADAKAGDLFFVRPDGSRFRVDGLAEFYREEFLRDAGVDRPELFVRSKSRIPIRVHDLRGFFVTYALAGGRTETWVADRTGHRSLMDDNYFCRATTTTSADQRLY